MSNIKNPAEIAERHQLWIILAMFLMGLKYVISAIAELVGKQNKDYLEMGETALALAVVGIIVPIFIWKFRNLSKAERKGYLNPDGYLSSVAKRALGKSWMLTLVFLIFIEIPAKKFVSDLPPRFFIQITLAVMFMSYGVVFFLLSRSEGAEDFG